MAKFKLTRTQKGDKFVYTVTDERGNVISTRTSKRDYVACTVNGEYYFGRLDLIGKGAHGISLSYNTNIVNNTEKLYKDFIDSFLPSCRVEKIKEFPKDKWIESYLSHAKERLSLLNTIVYLSK